MGSANSSTDVLPAGVSPEEGAGCIISGETRVHTRLGLPRASSLVGQQFEVWSGAGWTQARLECVGETSYLRVGLSDGSSLECSAAASWPVIKPKARLIRSPEARPVSPGIPPEVVLPASGNASIQRTISRVEVEGKRSPSLKPISRIQSTEVKQCSTRALDTGSASDSDMCVSGRACEWTPKIAMRLRPGDKIVTRPIVDTKDLLPALIAVEDARIVGWQHGTLAQGASNLRSIAAHLLGELDTPALTGDPLRAFIDGWAAAQGGYLVGPDAVMTELQMLLRRLGIWRTMLERSPASSSLVIASKSAWAVPEKQTRQWTRHLRSTSQVIIAVETLAKKAKMYRLVLQFSAPTTIMVGNTMLAVLPEPAAPT